MIQPSSAQEECWYLDEMWSHTICTATAMTLRGPTTWKRVSQHYPPQTITQLCRAGGIWLLIISSIYIGRTRRPELSICKIFEWDNLQHFKWDNLLLTGGFTLVTHSLAMALSDRRNHVRYQSRLLELYLDWKDCTGGSLLPHSAGLKVFTEHNPFIKRISTGLASIDKYLSEYKWISSGYPMAEFLWIKNSSETISWNFPLDCLPPLTTLNSQHSSLSSLQLQKSEHKKVKLEDFSLVSSCDYKPSVTTYLCKKLEFVTICPGCCQTGFVSFVPGSHQQGSGGGCQEREEYF